MANFHKINSIVIAGGSTAGWMAAAKLSQHFSKTDITITLIESSAVGTVGEAGMRKKIWHKNCLALGLASGFIEPLESTAIHLVYRELVHFIRNFPDLTFDPFLEQQFNREITRDYVEIRDFVILHYCTTQREDTAFWRWCKTMTIPDSLRERMEEFRRRGQLWPHPENLFAADSWCSIMEGMGIRPEKYHPLVDALDAQKLAQSLRQGAIAIQDAVGRLPSHGEFLHQNCPAK